VRRLETAAPSLLTPPFLPLPPPPQSGPSEYCSVQAKEHVRRLEAEAQQASSGREDDSDADLQEEEEPRDTWDCESVLTSRTTLYNHPARLGQIPRRR